tara:strand:- start:11055 stop:11732 length:678 start_codon:yes stop_codon:yes gene_type:complete
MKNKKYNIKQYRDNINTFQYMKLLGNLLIATFMNVAYSWSPNNFPFIIASQDTTKIREMIIESQGDNKRILDIGCGLGYSTSSSEGSLGIDVRKHNIETAQKLFPNKKFRHSFINAKYIEEEYDIVTSMFYLNNVPQYLRTKIIDSAIDIAKERVIIVDIDPDYFPAMELLEKKTYMIDYIKNCRNDLSLFEENVLVNGLLKIWIYNKCDKQGEIYEKYNEHELN